ncbi:helix-turn-helix domain-containing protein [Gilvimarinus xylanilyticus]|uniref:Helix-turn-helix domain-containing protein n=1 Tax=Gilvimarinus xylanilyticus TaxID=2944139 RepID=A0A9X2KST3_9GAMM|nr:helix-turn-helix domain-containing protein [Gilvimarinus xylanilyticus]MCP8898574.1 helix-turn-helix domain-containing protein [Gilvimarinus xylanilyticus]
MIQLQRLSPQNSDQEGFARSGIRSYHEYVVLAHLPEVEGVSAKVIEALQKRVGHSSMAIEHIAQDLNLSKRTLQRRLQHQSASFAQLRDSLRFHYAIKYLIDEHMSVDSVSSALDFSDRTSFTNAFKRWTNLSPSVFRKLFRDYA